MAASTQLDTFVVTGDINAMWLRDSTNQVLPYLRFATQDAQLNAMLAGLIARQTECVLIDAHANAFNLLDFENAGPNQNDISTRPSFLGTTVDAYNRRIFERKFEIDSLLAFFKLANSYYAATNSIAPFKGDFVNAVSVALDALSARVSPGGDYFFQRKATEPTDTLAKGIGFPVRVTGMLATPFRPSDDATTFQFNVPGNAMAVVELRAMSKLLTALNQTSLAAAASALSTSIDAAIQQSGVTLRGGQKVYAYEVDGFGNSLFMDDGNVPSLLSLPYLGYVSASDPLYKATRAALFTEQYNPYFFTGSSFSGIGSPHTPRGFIWPMSLIVQALTSTNDTEIQNCLGMLKASTAGTNFMHESFNPKNPTEFTRPWFAWANSLFGQLMMKLIDEKPHLILKGAKKEN